MSEIDDENASRAAAALTRCFFFELDGMARAKVLSYAKQLARELADEARLQTNPKHADKLN